MRRDRFDIRHLISRIAIAILSFHAWNASAQSLMIPEDIDPSRFAVRPLYKRDTVKIRFIGDIMMHSPQISLADKGDGSFDFSSYYKLMEKYLSDSDLNVGNMEFTLSGEPYTGYPSFSAPDSYVSYLADAGFDVFLCANNHIMDKGRRGLRRTIEIYNELVESHGIRYTGIASDTSTEANNNPLIVRIKGIRIAFVNATYGTNANLGEGWPDTYFLNDRNKLRELLESARSKADIVVAVVHWGIEHILKHNKTQEDHAKWLAENGADVIIGAHPHVVQDTEVIKTKEKNVPVVYSLGNSVSNMSRENCQLGLMTTLQIVRDGMGNVEILNPEHMFTWCSRPGGYGDSYYVIPITDYLGKKDEWKEKWDYDHMISTLRTVEEETGIKETTK